MHRAAFARTQRRTRSRGRGTWALENRLTRHRASRRRTRRVGNRPVDLRRRCVNRAWSGLRNDNAASRNRRWLRMHGLWRCRLRRRSLRGRRRNRRGAYRRHGHRGSRPFYFGDDGFGRDGWNLNLGLGCRRRFRDAIDRAYRGLDGFDQPWWRRRDRFRRRSRLGRRRHGDWRLGSRRLDGRLDGLGSARRHGHRPGSGRRRGLLLL